MDSVSLIYYGLVCGLLALAAPLGSGGIMRFVFGICVGLVAAAMLPAVRTLLG